MHLGVILDRAHGSNVPGKRSPNNEFIEWEFSRDVIKILSDKLLYLGFDVRYTVNPEDPLEPGLSTRAKIANKIISDNPDTYWIFISIHADFYGTTYNTVTGFSVYSTKASNNSDILAECIRDSAAEELPKFGKSIRRYNSGLMEENFTVIYMTNCPAVLTENLFYSNKDDILFLKSTQGKNCIADYHIQGILNFFKKMKYNIQEN